MSLFGKMIAVDKEKVFAIALSKFDTCMWANLGQVCLRL